MKIKPVYKEPIWGGSKMKEYFSKDIPSGHTGESWELACHENGMSIIENGPYMGKSLYEIIKSDPEGMMGKNFKKEDKFPILIKILDAKDNLSVQVHPSDDYASIHENGELGKTEMWYVADAEIDSKLVYGLKEGITKEEFIKAVEDDEIEKSLNFVDVKKGDVFFMPSGKVHAIGKGILIIEIQQNSDTTYRVYDYKRKDANGNQRDLHIDKAIDVIDFENNKKNKSIKNKNEEIIGDCKYFKVKKIDITNERLIVNERKAFQSIFSLEGNGVIIHNNEKYKLSMGDTYFIPASIKGFKIEGDCQIIHTTI